jgi:CubicO group peptidase (beta-lactamase class C family)
LLANLITPLAALFLVAGCATGAPGLVAEAAPEIRQIAKDAVDRGFAPGLVVMISERGTAPVSFAYGKRAIENGAPAAIDDLFRIYSMTKPVTSVAALILVDNGVIALDDPVAKYIPAFAKAQVYISGATLADLKTAPLERPMTIRDLMRHTAGLTYKSAQKDLVNQLYVLRGVDTGSGADTPPQDGSQPVASSAELAERIAAIPLLNQPGARFTYGNATDVLGRVVEVASGERLGAFMKRRIFDPLGMADTTFRIGEAQVARMTAAYSAPSNATGTGGVLDAAPIEALTAKPLTLADRGEASVFATDRRIDFGGAGLVSTANDYMKFAEMLLGGGARDGVRILSPARMAELTQSRLPPEALENAPGLTMEGLDFGLGVAVVVSPENAKVRTPEGVYFWGGAASTNFWVDPENEIVGVVMSQVFGGDVRTFYLEMLSAIYER